MAAEEAGSSGHAAATDHVHYLHHFQRFSAASVEEPVAAVLEMEKRAAMPAASVAIPEAEGALAEELVQAPGLPRASSVVSAPVVPSQIQPAARRGNPQGWIYPSTGPIAPDRGDTRARHPQRAGQAALPYPGPGAHILAAALEGRRAGPISRWGSCR